MRKIQFLLLALVISSLSFVMSCNKKETPGPSPGEEKANELVGTWSLPATFAPTYGGAPEGTWTGFSLTFSNVAEGADGVWGGSYSVTSIPDGYGQVWGGTATATTYSGTWKFAGAEASDVDTIVRDDNVQMINVQIDGTSGDLSLQFTVPDPGTARISGLFDAQWSFQFEK